MSQRSIQYRANLYGADTDSASIQSSTNASPIVITTASAHGFSNDDTVRIENHLVNTAANGVWTIANKTDTTFELSGSTGNGVGGATGTAYPADTTYTHGALTLPPELPGQIVRPHLGRTESVRMDIEVLDESDAITGVLSDADGRLVYRGRLFDIQRNVDSGGWTTIWTGRVTDITMADELGAYIFSLSDERWVERGTELFTAITPTTQLWPPGLVDDFYTHGGALNVRYFPAAGSVRCRVSATTTDLVVFRPEEDVAISTKTIEWLRDRAKNHENLLLPTSDKNYDDVAVEADAVTGLGLNGFTTYTFSGEGGKGSYTGLEKIIVNKDSHGYSAGDWADVRIYSTEAEASDALPYHIGGADGIDPMQVVKNVFDNTYGGETQVRYDSSLFSTYNESTNATGLLGRFPDIHLRITSPENMATFLERLYAVYGIVPFIDSNGRVAPKVVRLPKDITPGGLTQFTESNTASHPSWHYVSDEVTTKLVFQYEMWKIIPEEDKPEYGSFEGDNIQVEEIEFELTHDRATDLSEESRTIKVLGYHDPLQVAQLANVVAKEQFDRFGDGPIRGSFQGMPAAETVDAGDYVILDIDTYPDMQSGTRGQARIVQILRRSLSPAGPTFEYLDAGPNSQPLAAPTVTLTKTGKHTCDAAISSLASGATYILQIDRGDGRGYLDEATGTAEETVGVERCPSGTEIKARARVVKVHRIGSVWGDEDTATTDSLSPPTSASATNTNAGDSIILTWTNGESDYPIMPTYDGADWLFEPLKEGSTWFRFVKIGAGPHTYGVKHVDPYGGASSVASDTGTGDTATDLSPPDRLRVLQGWGDSNPMAPRDPKFGTGVELMWNRGEAHAPTIIQWDDALDFGGATTVVAPAGKNRIRIELPITNSFMYFRARHELEDFNDSTWTSIVSAKAVFLTRDGGPDNFPSGWAMLTVGDDGYLEVNVGSTDPDTEKCYYRVDDDFATGSWPVAEDFDTADDNYHAIAKADFPYNGDALDDDDAQLAFEEGNVAYATFRFWNKGGFGQTVYAMYPPMGTYIQPVIDARTSQTGGTGTLELAILDPQSHLQEVWFKDENTPGEFDFSDPEDASWTQDSTSPYSHTVTIQEKHPSYIGWAVKFTDQDGNSVWQVGVETFDADAIPSVWGGLALQGQTVRLSHLGDEDLASIGYVTSKDSLPGDMTGQTTVNGRQVDGTEIETGLAEGETLFVRVRGYSAVDGGGTASSEDWTGRIENTGSQIPRIYAEPGQSGSTGSLGLTIEDPHSVVNETAFKSVAGAGDRDFSDPTDGSWDRDTVSPFETTDNVSLTESHVSHIGWAVGYDLDDGNGTIYIIGAESYDYDTVPEFSAQLNGTTVGDTVALSWQGDEDLGSIEYMKSQSSMPTEGDLDGGGTVSAGRYGHGSIEAALKGGNTLYVRVRGWTGADGTGTQSAEDAELTFHRKLDDRPTVVATPSQSGADATVSLDITEGEASVKATAFDRTSATVGYTVDADPANWDVYDNSSPFTSSKEYEDLISPKHEARIYWAVQFYQDGLDAEWITGYCTFDSDLIPEFAASLTLDDASAYLSGTGDEDLKSIQYLTSLSSIPANVTGGTAVNTPNRDFHVEVDDDLAEGQTLYIRVRGYNDTNGSAGGGTESTHDFTGQITKTKVQVVSAEITFDDDGYVIVSATASANASNIYYTADEEQDPGDPTNVSNDGSISGSSGSDTSNTIQIDAGKEAWVKLRAYDSNGNASDVFGTIKTRRGVGKIEKTVYFPISGLCHGDVFLSNGGYVYASGTDQEEEWGSVPIPQGVTITEFGARVYEDGASDSVHLSLVEGPWNAVMLTIADVGGSGTGWTTPSDSANHLVDQGTYVRVVFDANTDGDHTRGDYIWVTYDAPDVNTTL